jgi:hypothetical protein
MNESCGCCEGTEKLTPRHIANRPGLSALHYRVGTHGSFLETMKARLSNMGITDVDPGLPPGNSGGQDRQNYPLQGLSTRSADDPSIAMLDAWATVADVLTFYQERIANEGYLLTATERRSILELSRLVGYSLRPGVAASVYLAYTLEDGAEPTTILPGNRAQALPGPGELPQSFETSEKLEARAAWNNLKPRQTRPQFITQDNADIIDTLYFQGVATNLKPNDPLLLVIKNPKNTPGQPKNTMAGSAGRDEDLLGPVLRFVKEVEPQNAQNRTKVTLQADITGNRDARTSRTLKQIRYILDRYLDTKTFCVEPEAALKLELEGWKGNFDEYITLMSHLKVKLTEAIRDENALLATWLGALLVDLHAVIIPTDEIKKAFGGADMSSHLHPNIRVDRGQWKVLPVGPSPSRALAALITPLLKPATPQVANGLHLKRDLKQELAVGSDLHPQIFTILQPSLKTKLYPALATASVTELSELEGAQAFRVKAAPFGNNAPLKPIYNALGIIIDHEEWPLNPVTINVNLIAVPGTPDQIQVSIKRNNKTWDRRDLLDSIRDEHNPLKYDLSDIHVSITVQRDGVVKTINVTFEIPSQEPKVIDITLNLPHYTTVRVNAEEYVVEPGQRQSYSNDIHHVEVAYQSTPVIAPARAGTVLSVTDELFVALLGGTAPDRKIVALDALYEQITPGSSVVVEYSDGRPPLITRVEGAHSVSKADYGITGKVTELTLKDEWLGDIDLLLSSLRGVTIYAQSTPRDLAEEPIDPVKEAVCGDEIELDGLYDGLQSGRWVIVTGERTDIFGVSGVMDTELAMLKKVTQGVHKVKVPDEQRADKELEDSGKTVDLPGDKTHTFLTLDKALAYTYKRDTVTIYGNVVKATHGETRNEVLGSGDGSKDFQQFSLHQSTLTYLSAPTAAGAVSTLQVRVNDILWHEADDLIALGPRDCNFITQTDDDGKTTVIFGDGEHGVHLPTGVENVKAVYRAGIGKPGNVKANQITLLATRPLGVTGVTNPKLATGGADKEGRDQARRNAPLGVMALDRLVSVQDYADFARTFAGIGKASAARLSDGHHQFVHLTVAGADNIPIDTTSDLYQNLLIALQQQGDPALPLQLATCEVMLLVISAQVRLHPDYAWESVAPKIRTTLLDTFGFERRALGQPVFQSEVISTIQNVEGVEYVNMELMDAVDQKRILTALKKVQQTQAQQAPEAEAEKLADMLGLELKSRIDVNLAGPVYHTVEEEQTLQKIADLYQITVDELEDLNPQFRNSGNVLPKGDRLLISRLWPAQLAFLTPDVPDTLILTELSI